MVNRKTALNLIFITLVCLLGFMVLAKQPQQRNYLDILRVFWSELYPDGGSTLYCGRRFEPFDREVNVEHVYPMSWVTRALKCGKRDQCRRSSDRFNLIESDMHNLYPARKDVNKARGAFPYAMIEGERHEYAGCDFEVDYRAHKAEPGPEARGRIARSMMYMQREYGLQIYGRQQRLLEQWHRQYPPDDEERRRNRIIERVQGNANPYIR